MHGHSQEFGLDGSKAKKSNHMVIVFKLMQISLNAFIQKFKIMNDDLGSGDKLPSARDNNLFQLSVQLSANLHLALIR